MKIGYARVSTVEQSLALQEDALQNAGCEKIIVDKISGSIVSRPGLEKVIPNSLNSSALFRFSIHYAQIT